MIKPVLFSETGALSVPEPAITAALCANSLEVRDARYLLRGMIAAQQPLSIDGVEICADPVLAELVEYATAERGMRELETLTLKKTSYGVVESTVTSIPKYCFGTRGGQATVFVHPVPRWSLEELLSVAEETYAEPYPCNKGLFVLHWLQNIRERLREAAVPGSMRAIHVIKAVPQALFPAPPHIRARERCAFAARILNTVAMHHSKEIYHDCISSKTVFFPAADQVQLLANYAGVPSAMLADELPAELIADDANARYGAHCRDVYAVALLCYRIVTGEKIDGRTFSVSAPRPIARVLESIAGVPEITLSFKSCTSAQHSIALLLQIGGGCIQRIPRIFTPDAFVAWRNLNRATGGAWRSLPVLGHLCDVFAPTPCAAALRVILDKHWFGRYLLRTGRAAVPDAVLGPLVTTLVIPFCKHRPVCTPLFGALFNRLSTAASVKRQAFGSLMEVDLEEVRVWSRHFTKKRLAAAVGVVIGAGVFLLLRSGLPPEKNVTADTPYSDSLLASSMPRVAEPTRVVVESVPLPDTLPGTEDMPEPVMDSQIHEAALPEPAVVKAEVPPIPRRVAKRPKRTHAKAVAPPLPTPAVPVASADAMAGNTAHIPAEPQPAESVAGLTLKKLSGNRGVYIVGGDGAPCNPGVLIAWLKEHGGGLGAADKLFMVHASSGGEYGDITALYRCASGECDSITYFEAAGVNKRAKPATTAAGDVLSESGYDLRLFLRDFRSKQGK